ncbi:MAG TPA: hypothetical protein VK821_11740 [Dehalococcoidia bacterium]|nr:hypothetical protein [Dehalococcoidia bacterium]
MAPLSDKAVRELQEEHVRSLEELIAANRDLGQRVLQLGVTAVLDRDDDVLILTIGKPQEAVAESIDNTLYFRADPRSLKIVGLELRGFRGHVAEDSKALRFCLDLMQVAGQTEFSVLSDGAEASARDLGKAIRQLVTA